MQSVPRQQCATVFVPQCRTVTRQVCEEAGYGYGGQASCHDVRSQECEDEARQQCDTVEETQCRLVDRQQCQQVPQQVCDAAQPTYGNGK